MQHRLTALLAFALLFAGCAQMQHTDPIESVDIPVGEYVLTAIEGEPIDAVLPESARTPTMSIERDGGVAGTAGVNRYSTLVQPEFFSGGPYRFREIATSRMAGPPDAMRFEQRFLSLLGQVHSSSIDPGVLSLHGADGRELLRFAPPD